MSKDSILCEKCRNKNECPDYEYSKYSELISCDGYEPEIKIIIINWEKIL